jgi:L-rhamnonate dehydratase
MRITDVEAIIVKQPNISMIGDGTQDSVIIRVYTDEGITGIGEVDSSPYVVKACIDAESSHMTCIGLRNSIVGEDPFDVEKIWSKMYIQSFYYGRRGVGIHAMSGIDMALWDIMGKKMGLPVHKLLGGKCCDKIPAYCSILMPESVDEIKAIADEYSAKGFQWFKFGWGALGWDMTEDLRLVKEARKALGDNAHIMIDIGKRWGEYKKALYLCDAFMDENVYWVEEPFMPDDIDSYRRLTAATKMRIAAGEEICTLHEYDQLIREGGIDIVQPDMSRCGGLTVARKIAALASLKGINIVPHNFKSGILMSASLNFLATIPGALLLEYCCQETVLSKHMIKNHYKIESDGCVTIPNTPGLGFELDEDILSKYRVN